MPDPSLPATHPETASESWGPLAPLEASSTPEATHAFVSTAITPEMLRQYHEQLQTTEATRQGVSHYNVTRPEPRSPSGSSRNRVPNDLGRYASPPLESPGRASLGNGPRRASQPSRHSPGSFAWCQLHCRQRCGQVCPQSGPNRDPSHVAYPSRDPSSVDTMTEMSGLRYAQPLEGLLPASSIGPAAVPEQVGATNPVDLRQAERRDQWHYSEVYQTWYEQAATWPVTPGVPPSERAVPPASPPVSAQPSLEGMEQGADPLDVHATDESPTRPPQSSAQDAWRAHPAQDRYTAFQQWSLQRDVEYEAWTRSVGSVAPARDPQRVYHQQAPVTAPTNPLESPQSPRRGEARRDQALGPALRAGRIDQSVDPVIDAQGLGWMAQQLLWGARPEDLLSYEQERLSELRAGRPDLGEHD